MLSNESKVYVQCDVCGMAAEFPAKRTVKVTGGTSHLVFVETVDYDEHRGWYLWDRNNPTDSVGYDLCPHCQWVIQRYKASITELVDNYQALRFGKRTKKE